MKEKEEEKLKSKQIELNNERKRYLMVCFGVKERCENAIKTTKSKALKEFLKKDDKFISEEIDRLIIEIIKDCTGLECKACPLRELGCTMDY